MDNQKSVMIRVTICLIAGCPDIVRTATRHAPPLPGVVALPQNSRTCTLTIASPVESHFKVIIFLFRQDLQPVTSRDGCKNSLLLTCRKPFDTAVKGVSSQVKARSGNLPSAWLESAHRWCPEALTAKHAGASLTFP